MFRKQVNLKCRSALPPTRVLTRERVNTAFAGLFLHYGSGSNLKPPEASASATVLTDMHAHRHRITCSRFTVLNHFRSWLIHIDHQSFINFLRVSPWVGFNLNAESLILAVICSPSHLAGMR